MTVIYKDIDWVESFRVVKNKQEADLFILNDIYKFGSILISNQ